MKNDNLKLVDLRSILEAAEPGVRVLELEPTPAGKGFWYLISTGLPYPKYVIGTVDNQGHNPQQVFSCGIEENAKDQWQNREALPTVANSCTS